MTKSIATDVLTIAYEEQGPPDGPAVVLVHGFPDDATSWDAVGTRLSGSGVRVLAPHLRGFGPTTFRADATPRSGQLGALVDDLRAFMDALGLERVSLAGQDWGARAAQGVSALHPDRVEHLASLGSYGLTWDDTAGFPPAPVLQSLWYQWILMLDIGEGLLNAERESFCRFLWEVWSPTWTDRESAYDSISASLLNPDFVAVALSAYRHGRSKTTTDPAYDHIDAALDAGPRIEVPTTILLGADDGIELPQQDDPRDASYFPQLISRRLLPGVGHFPHREAPDEVAAAILARVGAQATA